MKPKTPEALSPAAEFTSGGRGTSTGQGNEAGDTDAARPIMRRVGAFVTPQPTGVDKKLLDGTGLGCWSVIGVYGDGTCPEVRKVVHCRNCPVYSVAALQVLRRPIPPGLQSEWSRQYASASAGRPPAKMSVVLFRIGAEWLALPTQRFQEVAEWRPIRSLPHRRQGIVLGLANVRGEALVCVSLGHFLGLSKLPSRATLRRVYHRLIVVVINGGRLSFPADDVQGPQRLYPEQLLVPPATLGRPGPSCARTVFHWGGHAVGLLEPAALFERLSRSLA